MFFSSRAFSRRTSLDFSFADQKSGAAISVSSRSMRFCFAGESKKPPEFLAAVPEGGKLVEEFVVHLLILLDRGGP